jgi:hypothetical protein
MGDLWKWSVTDGGGSPQLQYRVYEAVLASCRIRHPISGFLLRQEAGGGRSSQGTYGLVLNA